MTPERQVGLVRVRQDDEVRRNSRKPHPLRIVDRGAQLGDGQRLRQLLEVAEPVAPQDEVRLAHVAKLERNRDLRHRRAERLVDSDATFRLLHRPRHLLAHATQGRQLDRRTERRVRRVLAGQHLIQQAPERLPEVGPCRRPR